MKPTISSLSCIETHRLPQLQALLPIFVHLCLLLFILFKQSYQQRDKSFWNFLLTSNVLRPLISLLTLQYLPTNLLEETKCLSDSVRISMTRRVGTKRRKTHLKFTWCPTHRRVFNYFSMPCNTISIFPHDSRIDLRNGSSK